MYVCTYYICMAMEEGYEAVARIVAGEGHTLLLTGGHGHGKVFSWGKGLFGRLGNGTADQILPTQLRIIPMEGPDATFTTSTATIIDIAAGSYHSLALAGDGIVWSWGYNEIMDGQLGYESIDDSHPNPILHWERHAEAADDTEAELLEGKPPKVIRVAAGGMMSCAVSEDGILWMWGNCPSPVNVKSGHQSFALSICETPHPVAGLQGLNVVKVACGYEHVVAVVHEQETQPYACYTWGGNKYGQLGLGDKESRLSPQAVTAFDKNNVGRLSHISCGAYHTAVITEGEEHKKRSMCWTFGMGENGQLGQGTSQSLDSPHVVEGLPEDRRIVSVSCGLFHMAVVTEGGEIWCWGMERGLGLCPGVGPPGIEGGDYLSPVRIMGHTPFDASHCDEVACGAAHTVVSVNNGRALFAWGRGQNGILGTGKVDDSPTPCRVVWPPAHDKEDNAIDAHSLGDIDQLPKVSTSAEELAIAQKEISALKSELAAAKEQASTLHAAVYGTLGSANANATWAVFQEWDRMISQASYDDLSRLDSFYRQARSRVKEVLLEKKVEKLCKQLMGSQGDARTG